MGGIVGASDTPEKAKMDRDRREFLRNSVYAAYATPLITALLVADKACAASTKSADFCRDHPWHPKCP